MILVTGGTGLVGAHLLYKLVNNHAKVKAIYRNERKLDNVKKVFSCYTEDFQKLYNNIEWIKADILDVPALTEALSNIELVYHCAAFVSFEPDKYHLLRKTNIEGTANIVNLCCSYNIKKLCYVSSVAALGQSINNEPIDEDTVWNPEADNHVYGITKYGAEMEVWRASQEGLDVVIVNPGVIIGPGIWRYGSGSLFKKAAKGFKYYTSGSVGLVSVYDVVDIMCKLMESNIVNERYVLVAESWSYRKFLGALSKSVKRKPPKQKASFFFLKIIWRIDWLKTKLTGKRRQLTKHIVRSLNTKQNYNSDKVKTILNYSFSPIDQTIKDVGSIYQKQV
ncbi:NAD-dependent epimerase/dehydratase family protein [Seonamhaeicola sediminis]|uniref:NAD-dependent epimerase/dehydratase family protein n=1 Tax=Seonamhaeicola sediminis TaxID=2528206 RepID=A0A562YFZ3_9FLAO|nr:NAD-dependent epimerase/dehydratase family protein [Seonamhaeicola sediminis]TWO33740.1 NAD-dependent epimerase/dehydratase family protein [Seonamhaeicola sediminis]